MACHRSVVESVGRLRAASASGISNGNGNTAGIGSGGVDAGTCGP